MSVSFRLTWIHYVSFLYRNVKVSCLSEILYLAVLRVVVRGEGAVGTLGAPNSIKNPWDFMFTRLYVRQPVSMQTNFVEVVESPSAIPDSEMYSILRYGSI